MDKLRIGVWNIRGLNDTLKIDVVNSYTRSNKVDIMGVLETRIREENKDLLNQFAIGLSIENNVGIARNIRIVILWKAASLSVDVVCKTTQVIHCRVQ